MGDTNISVMDMALESLGAVGLLSIQRMVVYLVTFQRDRSER
jgi:hypothetical protein